jgi:hypothetical protein
MENEFELFNRSDYLFSKLNENMLDVQFFCGNFLLFMFPIFSPKVSVNILKMAVGISSQARVTKKPSYTPLEGESHCSRTPKYSPPNCQKYTPLKVGILLFGSSQISSPNLSNNCSKWRLTFQGKHVVIKSHITLP